MSNQVTATPGSRPASAPRDSLGLILLGVAAVLCLGLILSGRAGADWWQVVVLGIVEGITEFLPISSTGHLLLASDLIGFQHSPSLVRECVAKGLSIFGKCIIVGRFSAAVTHDSNRLRSSTLAAAR